MLEVCESNDRSRIRGLPHRIDLESNALYLPPPYTKSAGITICTICEKWLCSTVTFDIEDDMTTSAAIRAWCQYWRSCSISRIGFQTQYDCYVIRKSQKSLSKLPNISHPTYKINLMNQSIVRDASSWTEP